MKLILGIETSCDETAASVFDHQNKKILSNVLFSQASMHRDFGGVVPEIATRSHLEKIDIIVQEALAKANVTAQDIDVVAVTNQPGLAGSLLVGFSFAKGFAWALNKVFLPIDHNHGHIASAYLNPDDTFDSSLIFPFICLSVSGGHTSLYIVHDYSTYELIGNTIDDAAGEAFDKTAKILNLGYPGGPIIEQYAEQAGFVDFFHYPRTREVNTSLKFSFSGLKTAIFYDLINRNLYDQTTNKLNPDITTRDKEMIASSVLVCIGDILVAKAKLALKTYPHIKQLAFVGGVSCNKYLVKRLQTMCKSKNIACKVVPRHFSTDNAAMIAAAASGLLEIKYPQGVSEDFWHADIVPQPQQATMLKQKQKAV